MKLPQRLEMTTTRADFERLLPAAVGGAPFVREDDAYAYRDGKRGWRIGFVPLADLQIGLVRLERHAVDFRFEGYSSGEIDAFLRRFELHFRRGGG